jgi:hypothetical protein
LTIHVEHHVTPADRGKTPVTAQPATTLIEALQDASLFDEAARQVETLQTHMSWILLVGAHA